MNDTEKKRLIKLVKIGQKQLNMADEDYRAMLKRLTNKDSATKCNPIDLHRVIDELNAKGADLNPFAGAKRRSPRTQNSHAKSVITHKIRAVWIQMGKQGWLKDPSEQGLNAFARRCINKNRATLVLNVSSLNDQEASQVLEQLKKWHARMNHGVM